MLNKIPTQMVSAKGTPGDTVHFDGQNLVLGNPDAIPGQDTVTGAYDPETGALSLTLNGTTVRIEGFITRNSIGTGPQGDDGRPGINGVDGLPGRDGAEGPRGCEGPSGPRGPRGARGPEGAQGPSGRDGDKGDKGDQGIPGEVKFFIQEEDPGAVGAGAIWVKSV